MALFVTGCKESGNEPESSSEPQSLVLIYAVASNNLFNNFIYDRNEMLEAARGIDMNRNKVLIYSVDKSSSCRLQEIVKDKETGDVTLSMIKEYPELPLSVEPERINEVLEFVSKNYNQYKTKGLILWSHATGWLPWFGGSMPRTEKRKSFGLDNYDKVGYQCNIGDLAEAIPADVFDYIWFDCCYMANIETIYELKDKTAYLIGYVTEVWNDGMPYDLTLPYLTGDKIDLKGAAWELYNDYNRLGRAVTVSITDTSGLGDLAKASGVIFEAGTPPSNLTGIQNYSRISGVYFYDMGQLLRSYIGITPTMLEDFNEAMAKTVIYKLTSDVDFNYQELNPEHYSGLSMHHYRNSETSDELFYTTLAWFKDTRNIGQ